MLRTGVVNPWKRLFLKSPLRFTFNRLVPIQKPIILKTNQLICHRFLTQNHNNNFNNNPTNLILSKTQPKFTISKQFQLVLRRNFSKNRHNLTFGNIFINLLVNGYLLTSKIWSLVPDFLKVIIGFFMASYFLVFVALPILFMGLPLLIIGVYLYSMAKNFSNARISKVYLDYLNKSQLKLTGQNVMGFSNYNHPVKIRKLHSNVSRRIYLAFEYNEKNIKNKFSVADSDGKFIDRRPSDARFKLSDALQIRMESNIKNNELNGNQYHSLIIYEFLLLGSDYNSPKSFNEKIANVNVIIGKPNDYDDLDDDKIFDELFQTKDSQDSEQPFIIELIPSGLNLNRFIINTPSEFDNDLTDRVITINDYTTKTYE